MRAWVDIEDPTGDRVGDGPLLNVLRWQHDARIDEVGQFTCEAPAGDPRAALIGDRYRLRCYGIVDDAVTELGGGIVFTRQTVPGDDGLDVLRLSGPDLLQELADRTVLDLTVCERAWTFIVAGRGTVQWLRPQTPYPAYSALELGPAYDGNYATWGSTDNPGAEEIYIRSYSTPGTPEDATWLYVGHDARFDRAEKTFAGKWNTQAGTTLEAQYYNGSSWVTVPDLVDGTKVGTATWAQNGTVTWTRPSDWARYTGIEGMGNWFWVRFRVAYAGGQVSTTYVRLAEVRIYADVPTTDGVNQIMAYAPASWVRAGYPATATAKYLEFQHQSVLAALLALSEQGGQDGGVPVREHFRLGTGREIDWLSTFASSGVQAVRGIVPGLPDPLQCLISRLTVREDCAEAVSRIYPYGRDGITLALTTRVAPAGYVLNAASNYLERTSAVTALGRVEAVVRLQDVGLQQTDSYVEHPELGSNALFDAALEWLRTHSESESFYSLSVVGCEALLRPGQTLRVVYHSYRDGVAALAVDDVLNILSASTQITPDDVRTVGLEVSTIDRQALEDADLVVNALKRVNGLSATTSGQSVTIYAPASEADLTPYTQRAVDETVTGSWSFTGDAFAVILDPGDIALSAYAAGGGGGNIDLTADAEIELFSYGDIWLTAWNDLVLYSLTRVQVPAGTYIELDAGTYVDIDAGTDVDITAAGNILLNATAGDITLNALLGAVKIGDVTAGNYIEVANSGTLNTRHILPQDTDAYDLGSAAKLWRRGYLSELDTFLLVENAISVVGGIQVIGHGQGTLAAALGDGVGDTQIDVGGGTNLVVGDFILLRVALAVEYLTVTVDDGGGLFTVTRDVDGSGRNAWPQGTVWLNLGQLGDGRIELSAATTPRISILQQGATYNVTTEVVRIGDLDGAFGVASELYGLGVGDYAGKNYLLYEPTGGFRVVAGDGAVGIDDDGVSIDVADDYFTRNMLRFLPAAGPEASFITDVNMAGLDTNQLILASRHLAAGDGGIFLWVIGEADYPSIIAPPLTYLHVLGGATGSLIELGADAIVCQKVSGAATPLYGTLATTARAYRSYAQTIASATWTALVFDRQERDTDNIWGWTPLVFTGAGVNDMTREDGIYTSTTTEKDFVVEIDGTGTPDTFQWSDDGGVSWDATDVAITGANQTLTNGVIVKFAATTGHTLGDSWAWTERPMNRFTVQHDGDYLLGAVATLPPGSVDATGARFSVAFRVDGATYVSGGVTFVTVSGAYCIAGEPPVSVYLTAGQYVEMMVIHGLAGNKDLHYGATFVYGWMSRQA